MKCIIIDDEQWILYDFAAMKCFGVLKLDLITCSDPYSAVTIIKQQRPEIIITDIRMSGLSGFELIQRIDNYNHEIILISSFSEFDYAKKAINLRVADYILKPVEEEKLYDVLKNAIARIEEKKYKDIYSELSNNTQEFLGFISSASKIDGLMKKLINQGFDLNSHNIFAEFKIKNIDISSFLFKTYGDILKKLSCKYFFGMLGYNKIFCIFNSKNKEDLQLLSEELKALRLCIGISEIFTNIKEVEKYYKQADIMAESDYLTGDSRVYTFKSDITEIRIAEELTAKISQYSSVEEIIDDFDYLSYKIKLMQNLEILCTLYNKIMECAHSFTTESYNYEEVNYKNISDKAPTIKILIYDLFENLMLLKENNESITNNQSLMPVIEYVKGHIFEKIQLYSVAEQFHINPNYLSQLFKREMNVSFTDFVIQLKMKKASELLVKTDMSLFEISENVGYDDYVYFCKTFKKIVHQSPSLYRKNGVTNHPRN